MKSEKDKMLAGELYDAGDEQLAKERTAARELLFEFNALRPTENVKGCAILCKLLTARGSITVEAPFHCDYGYNIVVGNNFYANFSCIFLDVNTITIGDNVMFGPYVQLYTATHPLNAIERSKGPEFSRPITVGNNVWIGGGTVVCPGVSIGSNTTIGAGSVVTKDIPDNVLAVGNPCKVIRALE